MEADSQDLRARRRAASAQRLVRQRRHAAMLLCAGLGAAAFVLGIVAGTRSGDGDVERSAGAEDAATPFAIEPLPALTDSQLTGQRLIAGFDGTEAPAGLKRMIRTGQLAGVILFDDNTGGRAATERLISTLQRIPRPAGLEAPLAVMVDQEGGAVKRVDGPPSASGAEMGARGQAFAARQGAATARSLRELGFNVNLAPVLDVGRENSAIVEEGRSFGGSANEVIETAVAGFAEAQRSGGVVAAAKHFPGFGSAEVNTDFSAQEIGLSRARLRRIDEAPFEAFTESGGEVVMLALASYPAFADRPAALSRSLATGELRGRIGFEGVSITDSLDAEAVTSFAGRDRVATLAADAGSDLLLYGDWRTARGAASALRRGLSSGALDREQFEESVQRVLGLRGSLEKQEVP